MDLIYMFLYVFFIFVPFGVNPASATYCSYYGYNINTYCPYLYYYYYDYYSYSSAGTIAGAVVGSIVGVAIIIAIILAVCGAFKTTNRRGVVVQPMPTTATVVATNSSQMQYQPMYNQYNQYPPPGDAAPYPPPQQNMAYPPPVETPAPAFHNEPPPYTGMKHMYV